MLTNFELNRDLYWRLLTLMCVTCMVFIVAESASASTVVAASNDVIGLAMCRITSTLSGGIAKSIATIAIFVVGIGLFMGKFNWSIALMTAAGVAVIFGANSFIGLITAGGANANVCSAMGT
jgi:type IV secretory pathway VirB2 component (pilin)